MFLNCTYVNTISFSDHFVTFILEGISILHLTGIFSCYFIIFDILCGLIRIDLFYPFQRILCGKLPLGAHFIGFQPFPWKS